jgi:hypothetical protein
MNRVVDIEVACLRYRLNIVRYRMLISYTISKVNLTFDIEGHVIIYRARYRIRYSIHPTSFTAERKLLLPRLHHACAEDSQRHVPWIPAPSFCAIPQLDPQRLDEERSFHSATSAFDRVCRQPAGQAEEETNHQLNELISYAISYTISHTFFMWPARFFMWPARFVLACHIFLLVYRLLYRMRYCIRYRFRYRIQY